MIHKTFRIEHDDVTNKGTLAAVALRGKGEESEDGSTTRFVASTSTPDRADDIVEQDWDMTEYDPNPVVMPFHSYHTNPIGKAIERVVTSRGLEMVVRWDDSPLNALGQLFKHQYVHGYMNAVSVGFSPGEVVSRSSLPREDKQWGERGRVYRRNRLLELSAVPIPMNAQALAQRGANVEVDVVALLLAALKDPAVAMQIRAALEVYSELSPGPRSLRGLLTSARSSVGTPGASALAGLLGGSK